MNPGAAVSRPAKLSGWGRFPTHEARVYAPRDEAGLIERVRAGKAIARGNGRAYGDSAVSRHNTVHMRHFDRLLSFDGASGELVAEAGVLLGDVIRAFLPLGWFPAVAPGTQFVTLGGMIAADVHGKNHHKIGGMRGVVSWIDLVDAGGTVRRCSPQENAELFDWTMGGMGLTGIVLRAAIRLQQVETGWIRQRLLRASGIDEAAALMEETRDATYSVAWLDCAARDSGSGRALILLGEHATLSDLDGDRRENPFDTGRRTRLAVPFDLPGGLLNRFSIRAFNALRYRRGLPGEAFVDWESFFFPLDSVLDWNRIYGRGGFLQFQCVLQQEGFPKGLKALLQAISSAGRPPALAVMKRLGEEAGAFSFPMAGYTLALDFPAGTDTLALMDELDRIALDHGGRFYLAKDVRMTAATLRRSDPRVEAFRRLRRDRGMDGAFASVQSERLEL